MSHMSLTEAGLWNVETHRPLAYFTQKPRERSSVIKQQLHVLERPESSSPASAFLSKVTRDNFSSLSFKSSVSNVTHFHLQPKRITTIKTILCECF